MKLLNARSTFSLPLSDSSTKGSLGFPQSKPIFFIAYFTGIGFTSQNRELINGNAYDWEARAFCQLPS